jgi:hypothetical protein
MGFEVGYTSATTGKGDHEVHKEHVVALAKKNYRHETKNFSPPSVHIDGTKGRHILESGYLVSLVLFSVIKNCVLTLYDVWS